MVLLLLINILNFQKSDYYTLIIVCTDYLQKLPEVVSIKRKTSLQSLVMRFLSDSVGNGKYKCGEMLMKVCG